MKKIFIIILFLIVGNIYSQSGWIQQNSHTTYPLETVFLIDSNTGYTATSNSNTNIIKTTDAGANWDAVYIFSTNATESKLFFLNSTTGFCLTLINNGLYKTTDGGYNWTQITIPSWGYSFLQFINLNTGYLIGERISKTINGGNNWVTYDNPLGNMLWGNLIFLDAYTGIAEMTIQSPLSFKIGKTTTGGQEWNVVYSDTTPIYSFAKASNNILFAGARGKILKSTNTGNNWNVVYTGSYSYYYKCIQMIDNNIGFAISAPFSGSGNYYIYKTTTGGNNWDIQYTTTSLGLFAMHFVNNNIGVVVGGPGVILRTNTGGVVTNIAKINNEIPNIFSMKQNYPNPFNPTTKIQFDVMKTENIKITVFDVAGKELEVLVNERMQPGSYETEWNGEKYASGIFFYRIQAGNYMETKKMVLMK
ncbi:MAG: T9SS type A sorting domain-containing protein [Ignavibacteria bacterium]|nr:T9SS type A sorting domain-containing protein [Ignavibacteria bacterium]